MLLRDLLDELGVARATVVGHSLGGGVAMQFVYQHPDYCERLVLIGSGGLGPDVGWTLRLLSAPGAELIMPIIAPQPVLTAGEKVRSWFAKMGIESPRGGEIWNAYSSFSDAETRQAFLRTLRSVVDYRGQAVSALNRLNVRADMPIMAIWGEQDAIIPVQHAYAALEARPGRPPRGDARCRALPPGGAAHRGGGPDRRLHHQPAGRGDRTARHPGVIGGSPPRPSRGWRPSRRTAGPISCRWCSHSLMR